MYSNRLGVAIGSGQAAGVGAALALALLLLFAGIRKAPRSTAAGVGLLSLFLVIRSGNALALFLAVALLGFTLLAGDGVARLIRGRETEGRELSILIATGAVALGITLLALGEFGLVRPDFLLSAAALLLLARRRRVGELSRQLIDRARALAAVAPSHVEALWLAIVAAVLFLGFLGALRPDLSWDALSYHLPEIRDFAEKGRVEPLPNLYPITFLWHNYETYLGLGFLAGGDRVVRLLHLGIGFAAFGSTAVLARRLGAESGTGVALAMLALAAFPSLTAQLMETYVDLPAALFLTAAAAEIAASRLEPRRAWLGGFLFGGAVATKVTTLLATVGLAILGIRRQLTSRKRLLAVFLLAAIPILPWLAWNQSRLGFFMAPYFDPWKAQRADPASPAYGPRADPRQTPPARSLEVAAFFRIPYDLAFHRPRFGKSDGFTGLLPLLLLVGTLGWGRRKFGLFCVAGLAAIGPWYVASNLGWAAYSNRYLVPIYPLYAVFAALGLSRLTENFRGRLGAAAGLSAAALAIAFPLQFLTGPTDLRIALKGASPESVLDSLPDYRLWSHVDSRDRVLFLGEHDRYHCPARFVVSDVLIHQNREVDPARWFAEWRPLGINVILYRNDWRDGRPLLAALGDCLHFVAGRSTARLYRVDSQRANCTQLTVASPGATDDEPPPSSVPPRDAE
jgi:hypothetical protein